MPLISIITATYNRSNVLRYTIQSVLRSTVDDWELIVVGDACTDDTAEVVADFQDPRIIFHNLPENVGDQCGPNNEGLCRAKGKYIAFLSHDDLWMPYHLETCLSEIERTGADFVYTMGLTIWPGDKNHLMGAAFEPDPAKPFFWLPASFWFMKKEAADEIGMWKHFSECLLPPSQDWLYRFRLSGKKIHCIRKVTLTAIVATGRTDVYKNREYLDNKHYFERMDREPDFIERELFKAAYHYERAENKLPVILYLKRGVFHAVLRIGQFFGLEPFKVRFAITYGGKGRFIKWFHKNTGAE